LSHGISLAPGSPAPAPLAWPPRPLPARAARRCPSRPSSPSSAASAPCSRSSPRSTTPPPSATHAPPHSPGPAAPPVHGGLRGKLVARLFAPRPHLLKSWSLRQTRSGSSSSLNLIPRSAVLASASFYFDPVVKLMSHSIMLISPVHLPV
jgi:hypothetical protein